MKSLCNTCGAKEGLESSIGNICMFCGKSRMVPIPINGVRFYSWDMKID